MLASLVWHLAVGVERGLDAIDHFRGADQKASLEICPVNPFELWAGLGQQFFEVEVLLADSQQWQAGENGLADEAAGIEVEDRRVQAKYRSLVLLRLERGVREHIDQLLGAGGGCEPLPETFKAFDRVAHRAGAAILRSKAVPHHEGAQRARRGATQAYQ